MQLIPINNAYLTNERKDNNITLNKESKISHNSHIKITNTSNKKPSTTNNMKEVTETDLYLLGAIEKLVYRVDFMEKRLRRVEEMLYYVMAGNRVDQGLYKKKTFTIAIFMLIINLFMQIHVRTILHASHQIVIYFQVMQDANMIGKFRVNIVKNLAPIWLNWKQSKKIKTLSRTYKIMHI